VWPNVSLARMLPQTDSAWLALKIVGIVTLPPSALNVHKVTFSTIRLAPAPALPACTETTLLIPVKNAPTIASLAPTPIRAPIAV
jgi:hypothetical protein